MGSSEQELPQTLPCRDIVVHTSHKFVGKSLLIVPLTAVIRYEQCGAL